MDDIKWWVWVIIAIAVIALIALVASAMKKRTAARAAERDRVRAGEIREEAQVKGVEASRREADAATARADADEARLAAEQREQEARQHEHRAGEVREEVDEHLTEADHLDPEVDRSTSDRPANEGSPTDRDLSSDDDGVSGDGTHSGEHLRDPRRDPS